MEIKTHHHTTRSPIKCIIDADAIENELSIGRTRVVCIGFKIHQIQELIGNPSCISILFKSKSRHTLTIKASNCFLDNIQHKFTHTKSLQISTLLNILNHLGFDIKSSTIRRRNRIITIVKKKCASIAISPTTRENEQLKQENEEQKKEIKLLKIRVETISSTPSTKDICEKCGNRIYWGVRRRPNGEICSRKYKNGGDVKIIRCA